MARMVRDSLRPLSGASIRGNVTWTLARISVNLHVNIKLITSYFMGKNFSLKMKLTICFNKSKLKGSKTLFIQYITLFIRKRVFNTIIQ